MKILMIKVGIINYNSGNIFSIKRIIEEDNYLAYIISDAKDLRFYDKLILPGVGAFCSTIDFLKKNGFIEEILENVIIKKKFFLGICMGMQVLTNFGNEGGRREGLKLIEGNVDRIDNLGCNQKLPHIGWNDIYFERKSLLFKDVQNNADFYFANNYVVTNINKSHITSTVMYGCKLISSIEKDNVFGVQFHPEKSSKFGKKVLNNFLEL